MVFSDSSALRYRLKKERLAAVKATSEKEIYDLKPAKKATAVKCAVLGVDEYASTPVAKRTIFEQSQLTGEEICTNSNFLN